MLILKRSLFALLFVAWQSGAALAADPKTAPLVTKANLVYAGAFRVPQGSTSQTSFAYGGTSLGFNPSNNSLYLTGHDWHQLAAEISIPEPLKSTSIGSLNTAVLRQNFAEPTNGKITGIGDGTYKIGGLFPYGGKLYVTGYIYYDAAGSQVSSHFVRSQNLSLQDAAGPYQVGNTGAGFVSGYMTAIPSEWQALLGGPALTGNCCLCIISRTSYGPAVSVFDPADLGISNPAPSKPLVYYTQQHPTLGNFGDPGKNPVFNGTTVIKGVVFPAGTRSVLFFGKHGIGDWGYGTGAECGDPTDDSKGCHAYPYVYQVWAYDANDLLSVKNGQKNPWEVLPYAVWTFNLPYEADDSHLLGGAAYDPQRNRIYISQMNKESDSSPVIQVFDVQGGVAVAGDSTPPSIPSGLRAAAVSSSQVNLSWDASTDDTGVAGYRVYRGTAQIADTPGTVYQDTELVPGTDYVYRVTAYDGTGNESSKSAPQSVTTPAAGGPFVRKPSVYPNPFVQGRDARINFSGIAVNSAVKIYTLSGRLVNSVQDMSGTGELGWDTLNSKRKQIKRGLYIYVLQDVSGNKKTGKIVIK